MCQIVTNLDQNQRKKAKNIDDDKFYQKKVRGKSVQFMLVIEMKHFFDTPAVVFVLYAF